MGILGMALALLLGLTGPATAETATAEEPYGGCEENRPAYAWTSGWRYCVRTGQSTFVAMPPCEGPTVYRRCAWDAVHTGGLEDGQSVVVFNDRAPRYVGHRFAHAVIANWND